MTEKELIKGCIQEDRYHQQELFRRYAGKMLVVCMRYTRHEMEAEDILQDAFIKVFDNINKFGIQRILRRMDPADRHKHCPQKLQQKEF